MLKDKPLARQEVSTLVTKDFKAGPSQNQQREHPWCEYGRKPGHTKETCCVLHGKLANWKP